MKIPKTDLEKRWTKGQGPGGQNRNKLETCCVLTHKPTGIQAVGDERTRRQSFSTAYEGLVKKILSYRQDIQARKRKDRRDAAIRDQKRVRTYDYSRGVVIDHRTGNTASLKDVLGKGKLDLLR